MLGGAERLAVWAGCGLETIFGLEAEIFVGLALPGDEIRFVTGPLFPRFGLIGWVGLFVCLAGGAIGLLGGDGRLIGGLAGFLELPEGIFLGVVFVLSLVVGLVGELGRIEDCLTVRLETTGLIGELGFWGI